MFSFSVDLCSGFPRNSSLALPLLSVAGFSVYLLTSNTASCDEDVGGVGDVEELVDKPVTTNEWHKFDFLQSMFLPFWVSCGFRPLVQW